ncbi:MAG TPA: murein biosynthesis integral membrane protein MurJ [bacterium]|nr:murein biosynthesis integral membrane protein MurJ [bacterium]
MSTGPTEPATNQRASAAGGLARAAGVIAVSTIASRGLGLIRDVLIAAFFGATSAKSAFVIAYSIPFFVQRLLVGGILSVVFIPSISELLVKGDAEETRRVVTSTLNLVLLIGVSMVVVGVLAAPILVPLAAPGYLRTNPSVLTTAVSLTRVMFVSMVFLALSGFVTGFLNAHHRFTAPAMAPLVFNVVIIACVLALGTRRGILGVAISFLAGWAAQFAVQLPTARRLGLRWGVTFDLRHPVLREMGRLAIPAMLGLAVIEINSNVARFFASFLPPKPGVDYVAVLDYAFTINQAPVGIFAVSLATALFPTMARRAGGGATLLRETTSLGLRGILFTMMPMTAVMLVLSGPIVRVVFQRGAFDPGATHAVALGLVGFAVGSVPYAAYYVVTRTFYALHDTRTPVRIGVYMILLNAVGDAVLMRWFGHTGIALATSLVAFANVGSLLIVLRRRLGGVDGAAVLGTAVRTAAAAAVLAVVALGTLQAVGQVVDTRRFTGAALQLLTALAAGGAAYLGTCVLFGVRELALLATVFRRSRAGAPIEGVRE